MMSSNKVLVTLQKEKDGSLLEMPIKMAEKALRDKETKFKAIKYWVLPENSNYVYKSGSLLEKKVKEAKKD